MSENQSTSEIHGVVLTPLSDSCRDCAVMSPEFGLDVCELCRDTAEYLEASYVDPAERDEAPCQLTIGDAIASLLSL